MEHLFNCTNYNTKIRICHGLDKVSKSQYNPPCEGSREVIALKLLLIHE